MISLHIYEIWNLLSSYKINKNLFIPKILNWVKTENNYLSIKSIIFEKILRSNVERNEHFPKIKK